MSLWHSTDADPEVKPRSFRESFDRVIKEIESGVSWRKVSQGQDLYHIAPTADRDRIFSHGLQPSNTRYSPRWDGSPYRSLFDIQPTGVYGWISPQDAKRYMANSGDDISEPMDIWRIPSEQIQEYQQDQIHPNARVVPHVVYPEIYKPYEAGSRGNPELYDPNSPLANPVWSPKKEVAQWEPYFPEWQIGSPTYAKTAMALHPNDYQNYIQRNGPYLHHWTTPDKVQSILQNGLQPSYGYDPEEDDEEGGSGNWQGYLQTRPGYVYLGDQNWRPEFVGPNSSYEQNKGYSVPLRIDMTKLNPQNFEADEDFAQQNWPRWTMQEEDTHGPEGAYWMKENEPPDSSNYQNDEYGGGYGLGSWADEAGLDSPQWTNESLIHGRTLAHRGSIPPEAISLHPDYNYPRQTFASSDIIDDHGIWRADDSIPSGSPSEAPSARLGGSFPRVQWREASIDSRLGQDSGSLEEYPGNQQDSGVTPYFPTIDDAKYVNRRIHDNYGTPERYLLDQPGLLEGAFNRAQDYYQQSQDAPNKRLINTAANLAHGVATAQAFRDGNHRTAYALTQEFLNRNGLGHISPQGEEDEELASHMKGYLSGASKPNQTVRLMAGRHYKYLQNQQQLFSKVNPVIINDHEKTNSPIQNAWRDATPSSWYDASRSIREIRPSRDREASLGSRAESRETPTDIQYTRAAPIWRESKAEDEGIWTLIDERPSQKQTIGDSEQNSGMTGIESGQRSRILWTVVKQSMAIDPQWLNSYLTGRQDPNFYHGTSKEALPKIAQGGLIPKSQRPDDPERWDPRFAPRPEHNYLGTMEYVNDPSAHPWESNYEALLRVNSEHLNPELINPDEDAVVYNASNLGLEPYEAAKYKSYGEWANANNVTQDNLSQYSLGRLGALAYNGIIPPEHLEYQDEQGNWAPLSAFSPPKTASIWRISKRLWLDDNRNPPDDSWEWAKNAREAQALLAGDDIDEISLDYDLYLADKDHKDYAAATGADVAAWAIRHNCLPKKVIIHSANPEGIEEIKDALQNNPFIVDPLEPDKDESMNHESKKGEPNEDDSQATPVHLLDTVLHNLEHTKRHVERFNDSEVAEDPESVKFNYEHAIKHLDDSAEHAEKVVKHLREHDVDSDQFDEESKELTSIKNVASLLSTQQKAAAWDKSTRELTAAEYCYINKVAIVGPGDYDIFSCPSCRSPMSTPHSSSSGGYYNECTKCHLQRQIPPNHPMLNSWLQSYEGYPSALKEIGQDRPEPWALTYSSSV